MHADILNDPDLQLDPGLVDHLYLIEMIHSGAFAPYGCNLS